MSLKGTQPGTSRPKALTDMTAEEAAPWLAERVASVRAHPCICDLHLIVEAAEVARRIGAHEAAFLERLIDKLQTEEITTT
jgi:hypothetical protein